VEGLPSPKLGGGQTFPYFNLKIEIDFLRGLVKIVKLKDDSKN